MGELEHHYHEVHQRLVNGFGYVKPAAPAPDIPELIKTAVAPFMAKIAVLQKQIDSLTLTAADLVDRVVNCGEKIDSLEFRLPKPITNTDIKVFNILRLVSRFEGVSIALIRGKRRNKKLVYCRHLISYLASEHTGKSLVIVGNALGNRDHTTILHGIRKIESQLLTDSGLKSRVDWYLGQIENLTLAPASP